MIVTVLGMFTDCKAVHPEKALKPIVVILDGIAIVCNAVQLLKVKVPIDLTPWTIVTEFKAVQPEKTALPMLVIDAGKDIFIIPVQFVKALSARVVSDDGKVIALRFTQALNALISIVVVVLEKTNDCNE